MVLGSPIYLEGKLQTALDGLGSDEEYRRAETVQLGKRTKPVRATMTRLPMSGQSEDEETYYLAFMGSLVASGRTAAYRQLSTYSMIIPSMCGAGKKGTARGCQGPWYLGT